MRTIRNWLVMTLLLFIFLLPGPLPVFGEELYPEKIRKLAETGHAPALFTMGLMYEKGEHGLK